MIRLLTVNLAGVDAKHGTWPDRAARIAQLVTTENVDVVVAQAAIGASGGERAPLNALTALLPGHRHLAFAPAQPGCGGVMGSATLSRLPFAATSMRDLTLRPGLEDTNHRVLLHTAIDRPAGPLHVVNAHFSWVVAQAAHNAQEALELLATLDGELLLMGDLNQPPESEAMATLSAAGLVDAWTRVGEGAGESFETGRLFTRIDYAWARGAVVDAVSAARLIGGERDAALSDHRGLVVELDR